MSVQVDMGAGEVGQSLDPQAAGRYKEPLFLAWASQISLPPIRPHLRQQGPATYGSMEAILLEPPQLLTQLAGITYHSECPYIFTFQKIQTSWAWWCKP